MVSSIPLELVELGFGFEDYREIARNVGRVLSMPIKTRENILERACVELSDEVSEITKGLLMNLSYDRDFFEMAEIDYSKDFPRRGLFITTIADYLLRNKERLSC